MIHIALPAIDTVFIFSTILIVSVGLFLIMLCIWRAEGKFDIYLKLLAIAFLIILFKNILIIFGIRSFEYWSIMVRIMDLSQVLLFLISNVELFTIIRSLSGENEIKE